MGSWITSIIDSMGAFGIGLVMFLENLFPPIPSELIMPLAGYRAAQGEANLFVILIAGILGSLAGALFWYVIGRAFGEERLKRWSDRYGRLLTLTRDEIDKAEGWFDRNGGRAVLFGRLVPTIRTLISIPAGLAEMPVARFMFYTAIGTTIWTTFLTLVGYWAGGQHEWIDDFIDPVSYAVIAEIILLYLYRVVTYKGPGVRAAEKAANGQGGDGT